MRAHDLSTIGPSSRLVLDKSGSQVLLMTLQKFIYIVEISTLTFTVCGGKEQVSHQPDPFVNSEKTGST